MSPLELAGIVFISLFLIIFVPIAIGILVKTYWEMISQCYRFGRGFKKYKLVKIKKQRR